MSETESGDGEGSRRSRDSISWGCDGLGEGEDSRTEGSGDSEIVDREYSKTVFTLGPLILDSSSVKLGQSSVR